MRWVCGCVHLNFSKALLTISHSILEKLPAHVLDGNTLMSRKLVGWLVPESGGGWSYIQLAADLWRCSAGPALGPALFNRQWSGWGDWVPTQLVWRQHPVGRNFDLFECGKVLQRDLDRCDQWAEVNCMGLFKARITALGSPQPQAVLQAGGRGAGKLSSERGPGVLLNLHSLKVIGIKSKALLLWVILFT